MEIASKHLHNHVNIHLLRNDRSDDRFLYVSTSAIICVSVISHILSLATRMLFYDNKLLFEVNQKISCESVLHCVYICVFIVM